MRFKYSTTGPNQNEFDSLPRIPLILRQDQYTVDAFGLVDSGATINVLPYELGIQLGAVWDESKAIIQLSGNLSRQNAIPFFANAEVGEFSPVKLVFAWVNQPNTPLILGQTNFFLEFDVAFFRSKLEFEVNPKS
jgi:hypothetical protein